MESGHLDNYFSPVHQCDPVRMLVYNLVLAISVHIHTIIQLQKVASAAKLQTSVELFLVEHTLSSGNCEHFP